MVESFGNPTPADAGAVLAAGYSETHILGIILGMSAKVNSNYTNHIFHIGVYPAFASRA